MQITLFEANQHQRRILTRGAITYIGSADLADIQLQSDQIDPYHLQLVYWEGMPSECKVVNLSQTPVAIGNHSKTILAPQEFINLTDGNEIRIAHYRIVVHLSPVSKVLASSESIKASFSFPDTVLPPKTVMETQLTILNSGSDDDCQFQVEVRGLPVDCYKIDPIPLMYSGAVERVKLLIYHRKTHPAAGPLEIELRITAPQNYPGEEFVLRQGFVVSPVFEYGLEFESDQIDGEFPAQSTEPEEEFVLLALDKGTDPDSPDFYSGNNWIGERVELITGEQKVEGVDLQNESIEFVDDGLLEDVEEKLEEPAELKIISNQFDDFWDDND